MKRENWIYLLAFLCGVVAVNLLGSSTWANNSTLNRYSLASLSFQGIAFEEYFIHIIFLRFRTVAGVWVLTKLLPKKFVVIGVAVVISVILGAIAAMAIMANGVWGVFFYLCALLPHGIFYGAAYLLWGNIQEDYSSGGNRKINHFATLLILMLMAVGCVCETYICPILIENVIKF